MPKGGIQAARYCLLCVSIDHIATIRQARGGNEPDLIEAALLCEKSGCDGITVLLREDRRPIKDKDVFALKDAVRGKLTLQMALSPELIEIATKVKPNQLTIVPQRMAELTTEGALDIKKNVLQVRDTVKLLHDQTISVSLFVDPDKETIELSKECEADFVEINTAAYCSAVQKSEIDKEIERVYSAANHAVKAGIKVSARHGLKYENIAPVLKARALEQVTIGHSIIARSVFVGLPKAVKEMLDILD